MTGERDVSRETPGPWQAYLDQEHAAREMYLLVVECAHRAYLVGPWPDRGAYELVERQAWNTYYAAGRGAWGRYQAAQQTPPPPPAAPPSVPIPVYPADHRTDEQARFPRAPQSHPYPMPDRAGNAGDLRHGQATFTAYPANQPIDGPDQWPGNYLAAPPNPESGQ